MYTIKQLVKLPMEEELKQLINRYEEMVDVSKDIGIGLDSCWQYKIDDIKELLQLFYENKMSVSDWKRMKELATINREYRLGDVNNGKFEKRNFVLDLQ